MNLNEIENRLDELDAKLKDKLEVAEFNRSAVADALANLLPLMQEQSLLMREILKRTHMITT